MALETIRKGLDFLLGQTNAQQISRYRRDLAAVNRLADEMAALSDEELLARVHSVRQQLADGASRKVVRLELFALVREVAERQVGMRPFDVQIVGALALDDRKIAEMQTGEGKTLVATLPATLNALLGKVHVVTVNDYLARRDREWMGPIYEALGLTVGLLQEGLDIDERKRAYACDIVYGTNNQFGFDYLRDNMVITADRKVQGPLDFAIVDEIDNILVDEARTPLIISGSTADSLDRYRKFAALVRRFRRDDDFEIDEETRRLTLTDGGIRKGEEALSIDNLYAPQHTETLHHLETALRALHLFQRESNYIVKDGRVMIVDEFTGRLMPDRRYSDGLHQALEAKEGLSVQRESQTMAQITLQHYFQLYRGLCGMTGTAKTEEDEFKQIYGLPVLVIPTNRPLIRAAKPDVIYRTEKAKFAAIVEQTAAEHEKGRPVLIGTNSIDKSERLSGLLKARGLAHNVLNAKYHEREAEIVKDAGQPQAITVATNMAGRGTDIKLGEGVAEIGGLHVIGCQRHESRRIDNQLLGRAGRQGDPGSSQFFLSLEDDLLRIFGGDRIGGLMERLKMEEGEAIEHSLLTGAIRRAQKRVEGRNFEIRKRLLEFDLVMARQREAIYSLRDRFLLPSRGEMESVSSDGLDDYLCGLLEEHAQSLVDDFAPGTQPRDEWNTAGLAQALAPYVDGNAPDLDVGSRGELQERVKEAVDAALTRQRERLGTRFAAIAQYLILATIDEAWLAHLYTLDDLREGIGWTAYGGTDPLIAFKRESFAMFQDMLGRAATKIVRSLLSARLSAGGAAPQRAQRNVRFVHPGADPAAAIPETARSGAARRAPKRKPARHGPKVGRNEPCPCGSGRKYKNCCGRGV
ncbi:MAG: preprotein translocase subunit SecA [Candidatus Bipolaricaulota bacterium]|nr:MAG: preprotein translocase subunit SecA [Candidatus Bipolaricaulota bacterium]